jgi:hypothetical protein
MEFQMTGVPQVQGCLAIAWVPLCEQAMNNVIVSNFSALSVNQVCYLFANANTTARMTIPFNSPQAFINIERTAPESYTNTLGHLLYVVLNPVELGATASDTCSVSTFMYAQDNKFVVPKLTAPVTIVKQKKNKLNEKNKNEREQARTSRARPQASAQEHTPDTSILGKIGKSLLPENIVGDAIDAVTGIFGLDKPVDPSYQKPSKVVSTQPMNFAAGIENIDVMTFNPTAIACADQDTFATTTDEMSMDYLKTKYSYLGSFTFSNTQAVGDVIASFPMNPMPNRLIANTKQQIPLLSYLTAPYRYYTGSLTYIFQVVSTSFQTGKLLVSLNYDEYSPASPPLTSVGSQYALVVEINQGSNQFEFTADYLAATPKLYVPNSNTPSHLDSFGMINVSVLNPLVNQNGTPASIWLNVFMAAGKDFKVDTLSISNQLVPDNSAPAATRPFKRIKYAKEISYESDIEVIEIPRRRSAHPQSSAQPLITPMSNVDLANENLISPTADETKYREDDNQSALPSVRDVLKKYQMIQSYVFPMPNPTQEGAVLTIPVNSLFGSIPATFNVPITDPRRPSPGLLDWYSALYRQFRGGINFKIMMDHLITIEYPFAVFYSPPVSNGTAQTVSDLSNTLANNVFLSDSMTADYNRRNTYSANPMLTRLPITYVNGILKTAEFSVPFTSRFLSVLVPKGQATENYLYDNEVSDLGYIHIYLTDPRPGQVTDARIRIFAAFGDYSRFGTIVNVPLVGVSGMNDADGNFVGQSYPDNYSNAAPRS